MIKKYSEFIGESLEFLLESDVVYSDKLRKVLNKIDSPISQTLLGIENTDIPVKSNYFDIIKDKNDSVSFLSDKRAQDIIKEAGSKDLVRFIGGSGGGWLTHNINENGEIFDALGYTPVAEAPFKPQSSDIGELIKKTVSKSSGKTYAWVKFEGGEGVYNFTKLSSANTDIDKIIWSKSRQEIGIGRAIRALLVTNGTKFLDKDLESFVNLYKSAIDKLNDRFSNFEVVRGELIPYWYKSSRYVKPGGTLNSSCMKDHNFFDIYESNPDRIGLVIYKNPSDEELILGRALLWKTNDDNMFMDRIYTVNDSDVQLFREYAKDNGWYSKSNNNSSSDGSCITPDGGNTVLNLDVYIRKGYYENYPYLDTLKYWSPNHRKSDGESTGLLSNDRGYYTLEQTEGNYEQTCETCGGGGRHTCGTCDGNGNEECPDCEGSGRETCEHCDGGRNECGECDGSGDIEDSEGNKIDCPECSGIGDFECSSCDGEGYSKCSRCDGDGNIECRTCDGNGDVDCYECN